MSEKMDTFGTNEATAADAAAAAAHCIRGDTMPRPTQDVADLPRHDVFAHHEVGHGLREHLSGDEDKAAEREPDLGRSRELMTIAHDIAAIVLARIKPRERCRLRRMVELLLD